MAAVSKIPLGTRTFSTSNREARISGVMMPRWVYWIRLRMSWLSLSSTTTSGVKTRTLGVKPVDSLMAFFQVYTCLTGVEPETLHLTN